VLAGQLALQGAAVGMGRREDRFGHERGFRQRAQ
jgi:hypothetical protein